jgi:hypothetical protein
MEIVFNSAGFKEILESEGVRELVQDTAQEIADKANENYGGDGFEVKVQHLGYGGGRWGAFITSKDNKAAQAESEDKALTRALHI